MAQKKTVSRKGGKSKTTKAASAKRQTHAAARKIDKVKKSAKKVAAAPKGKVPQATRAAAAKEQAKKAAPARPGSGVKNGVVSKSGPLGKPEAARGKPARPQPHPGRALPANVRPSDEQRVSAPVTPKDLAAKAAQARQQLAAAKKPVSQRHGFKTNEYIVYPAHGVGRIVGIEEQEIAGMSLELFVINFEKDKMTLRVPTGKLQSVGMRKLAEDSVVRKAMETLKGRARIKRTMWSRRAQEYEAKINSGDLVSIAEVVRDLYRSESQPEQSYSERQLYEAALDRMAREIAAVDRLDERGAVQRITEVLARSARGRRLASEGAEASGDAEVKAA